MAYWLDALALALAHQVRKATSTCRGLSVSTNQIGHADLTRGEIRASTVASARLRSAAPRGS